MACQWTLPGETAVDAKDKQWFWRDNRAECIALYTPDPNLHSKIMAVQGATAEDKIIMVPYESATSLQALQDELVKTRCATESTDHPMAMGATVAA